MSGSIISKFVKNRLGDYKQQINSVDNSLPHQLSSSKMVGIIGAGLAGISAAIYLAERNFNVTVFDLCPFHCDSSEWLAESANLFSSFDLGDRYLCVLPRRWAPMG